METGQTMSECREQRFSCSQFTYLHGYTFTKGTCDNILLSLSVECQQFGDKFLKVQADTVSEF